MVWIWTTIIIVLAIATVLHRLVRKKNNQRLQRPPGPRGIPLLGHLHLLKKYPYRDLANLAKKYGPIMYMRFGSVPVIIVSSPQTAEQFLKKHDLIFASRPTIEASKYISYEMRNMMFASYGPNWRNIRKVCTLHLLSTLKINTYQPMRKEELCLLIEALRQAAKDQVIVDVSAKVSSLSTDMNCKMLFGKKYTDDQDLNKRGFKAIKQEIMELMSAPNLIDYFPYLGKFDIQGLTKRLTAVSKVFDEFLENIIDEHEQSKYSVKTKDFVDTMLDLIKFGEADFNFDRRHIKAIMLDMLLASIDTSTAVIEWTMSELLRNPEVLKKVKKELEEVIGMDRIVEESDLDSLEYLNMVVKESLRLHPPAPLLVPHEAMEDCVVEGFVIPKKSRIFINAWAIGRDLNAWSDPEAFIPERFIGNNIDVRGRDFQFIPFGSGRRSCPGIQLGLIVVRLVVAQLSHCFDWKLPYDIMPKDLDMTEHLGVVGSRANHLMAIPSYLLKA